MITEVHKLRRILGTSGWQVMRMLETLGVPTTDAPTGTAFESKKFIDAVMNSAQSRSVRNDPDDHDNA